VCTLGEPVARRTGNGRKPSRWAGDDVQGPRILARMTALTLPGSRPDPTTVLGLLAERPFVALTGAGLSTDSGIPDYRGPQAPARTPMTYSEFLSTPGAQQRYWARSHIGWSRMKRAAPNDGHRALAAIETTGRLRLLITQNVDGLHEAAGSRAVCALHGRIAEVVCLGCRETTGRAELHERMTALNPGWVGRHDRVEVRPDGDVELSDTAGFVVPRCMSCDGVLKPDVVFFGENVPKPRVERCYAAVDALDPDRDALLVLGSSLTVMSGLRFVKRATRLGVPVVIVNRGPTRADDLPVVKLEHGTSEFLTALSAHLSGATEARTL
jgi:NAD-dependent SIR2 family protein deacetylase